MPSDEERFAELEAELGRLQGRLQGLETRGEYLATREDVEKAKIRRNQDDCRFKFGLCYSIDRWHCFGGRNNTISARQTSG